MNGNRLEEHRKKVPFLHWALLAAVMSAMLILGPIAAKGAEYNPFKESSGYLVSGAEICYSPGLSTESITLLDEYQSVVDLVETYNRGGAPVPEELEFWAERVYENRLCVTSTSHERIEIIMGVEGYVLARFRFYNEVGTFIVARRDVLPDRGI